jgi:alpha-D-ribose 1-methylphosphonate 5-triphosphate synthase subunit PhnH
MTVPAAALLGDPAATAGVFRAILDATARPGRVRAVGAGLEPAPGLSSAATATILALVDADAPLWIAPALAGAAFDAFLRFHTGAAAVADPGRAAFAVGRWPALTPVERFAEGTADYPDRSATLIVEVDALAGGDGVALAGPGIDGVRRLAVEGADRTLWACVAANRARFPLGRDLILTAGESLAALPRTVRLQG